MPTLLTSATFLSRFPEFANAPGTVVAAAIDEAHRVVFAAVWGERSYEGAGYYAAHVVASSPLGERAKLVRKDGSTLYLDAYLRLRRLTYRGPVAL